MSQKARFLELYPTINPSLPKEEQEEIFRAMYRKYIMYSNAETKMIYAIKKDKDIFPEHNDIREFVKRYHKI